MKKYVAIMKIRRKTMKNAVQNMKVKISIKFKMSLR